MTIATRTLPCPEPLDAGLTFGPTIHGRGDPSSRIAGDSWWHARNTPAGAATVRVRVDRGASSVVVRACGPGSEWVLEHAADIAGVNDRPSEFLPDDPFVAALHHRLRGLRFVRIGCVLDIVVSAIIEQRVTSVEARQSWQGLVRRYGSPAPGGHDLVVPPTAEQLVALPDWEWRRLGVEGRRSGTVRRVAAESTRLDRAAAIDIPTLDRRLRSLNGVGPWTAAHVTHLVSGDPDAVPVGDWHLPNHVAYALAHEPRADDARMLELLEPFRPHRARVWRLIMAGAHGPPRRAPRARIHRLMHAEAQRARSR